jgi:D-sedoheptulose 7-phosphate isomerase
MKDNVINSLKEAREGLDSLLNNDEALSSIADAANLLIDSFKNGGRVFSCGNGGSMCDAMHFAEELSGRYRLSRKALPAVSISDPGHISCVGNDFGYDQIFSRYLEAHAKPGDCLLAISTSGKSSNIIVAAEYARKNGITVITLTGKTDTQLSHYSDMEICTPAGKYADRVQELHIKVIHILIELVERSFFPENYADTSDE